RPRPTPPPFPYTTLFRSGTAAPELRSSISARSRAVDAPQASPRESVVFRRSNGALAATRAGTVPRSPPHALPDGACAGLRDGLRSEEHTSELQSRENLVC